MIFMIFMATKNHSIQIEETSDRISCTNTCGVLLLGNCWGHAISLLIWAMEVALKGDETNRKWLFQEDHPMVIRV